MKSTSSEGVRVGGAEPGQDVLLLQLLQPANQTGLS